MHVLRDESLLRRNTLALEASANAYVSVSDDAQLRLALSWARDRELPVVNLGQGSNVVFTGDVDALVIHQTAQAIEVLEDNTQSVLLKVQAGKDWHTLVQWCLHNGYFGLENLALIPGRVGAAPIQNIGAYGVELSSFVHRVHAVSVNDLNTVTLDTADCGFGYRDSVFKQHLRDELVITAVELVLSKVPDLQLAYPALKESISDIAAAELNPQRVFDAVVAIRQAKLPDPAVIPNAGSFFKNPILSVVEFESLFVKADSVPHYPQSDGSIKVPAGWLIEKCGWKGRRIGDLGIHPEHSLVIINYGEKDGSVLLNLAEQLKRDVLAQYGVTLEVEPRVYGQ
ncbi:MAG: UDP-N-acetylmuramate dehydrogenase [Halioglobus sp.]